MSVAWLMQSLETYTVVLGQTINKSKSFLYWERRTEDHQVWKCNTGLGSEKLNCKLNTLAFHCSLVGYNSDVPKTKGHNIGKAVDGKCSYCLLQP